MIKPTSTPAVQPAARAPVAANQINGSPPPALRWGETIWSHRRHVGLRFATEEDLDAAIDCLWDDETLAEMPRVHVGDETMIVPAEAVPYLQQKGLRFEVTKVASAGDLSPAEINGLRRGTNP